MKKTIKPVILILVSALFISSCMSIYDIPSINYSSEIDLRKYSNKDFLFTSDGYSGKYKSCGFVNVDRYPEVTFKIRSNVIDETKYTKYPYFAIEKINLDEVIDAIYKKAIEIDANAIINLEIKILPHPLISNKNEGYEDAKNKAFGYSITGLAIKRIEN